MRRLLLLAALAVVLLTILFIRIQPAGDARVMRRGSSLHVAMRRIAFVVPGGTTCMAPERGGRLLFQRTLQTGQYPLNVNFAYEPPTTLPADWPDGDWCTSLSAFVDRHAGMNPGEDPRAAEARISSDLQRALAAAGLQTSSVSARLQLPPGWERTQPVPEVAKLVRNTPPLVFIGLDGADWQLLDDYIASGSMPNLARLVREGTSGVLETEHPPLSPLVWTTMMTGVSPLEHQILDFVHFNATTGAKEPITSDERAVPAVWNMATMAGKRVAVFGLWATYPAEPVHGLMVSDRLFTFLFAERTPPPGIVYPPSRETWARAAVDGSTQAIDFRTMHAFLPWLTESEEADLVHEPNPYAKPDTALHRILIETEIYRRLATDLMSSSLPDLTIVYFQGTDSIGHVFAPFAPPKQPEVSQQDYDRYHNVPALYFHHIDEILGQFLRMAERNHARIMLASDHGFRWKEGRPVELSSFATATAAKWHRNEGIFLLWGPGVDASGGHRVHGGVRQICATLLETAGLPAASGIAPALLGGRASALSVDYRRLFKPFVPPPPDAATQAAANEELAKLKALGYIGSAESTAPRPAGLSSTRSAGAYNNAGLILKHDDRIADSIASFEEALKIDPNLASAAWNLSDLLSSRNEKPDESDDLLLRALQNGLPEAPSYVIERAIKYQRSGRADRSLKLLEGAVARKSDDAELRMFRGRYRVELKNCAGALEDFQTVERLRPNDAIAYASAGLAQVCLGDHSGAQASFQRSLELNPNQPMLRHYLSQ